jgi:hypothetical protein
MWTYGVYQTAAGVGNRGVDQLIIDEPKKWLDCRSLSAICWQRIKNNYSPAEKSKVVRMDQHALVAVGPFNRKAG